MFSWLSEVRNLVPAIVMLAIGNVKAVERSIGAIKSLLTECPVIGSWAGVPRCPLSQRQGPASPVVPPPLSRDRIGTHAPEGICVSRPSHSAAQINMTLVVNIDDLNIG
jgi:hypothetical protein